MIRYLASSGVALSQQVQGDLLFGGRLAGVGDCRKGLGHIRQQEASRATLRALQKVLRGAAQVAMAQVGGMHCGLAGSGELGEDAAEQRSAHLQFAPVRLRERHSGKVQRRQPGLGHGECAQIFGHERALLQLAAGFGQTLAQLCELGTTGHACSGSH